MARNRVSSRRRATLGLGSTLVAAAVALHGWHGWSVFFVPPPLASSVAECSQGEQSCARRTVINSLGIISAVPVLLSEAWPSGSRAAQIWRGFGGVLESRGPPVFPVRFVAYFTRFLLNYDADFRVLWEADKQADAGPLGVLESVGFRGDARFARFSRTVELALQDIFPVSGASSQLLQILLRDYGTSLDARRQLIILFALLDGDAQPVGPLRKLLRSVENATVSTIKVLDGGEFSTETLAPPGAMLGLAAAPPGEGGRAAELTCKFKLANGAKFFSDASENQTRWVLDSVTVKDGGRGYASDADLDVTFKTDSATKMLFRPSFQPILVRSPGRRPDDVQRVVPGKLRQKLAALLPSDLLPKYSPRLGYFVLDKSVPLSPDPTITEERRRLNELYGNGRGSSQLDRFRADFVFADFDATYGPVGLSPLERERRLNPDDFLRLALGGGIAYLAKEVVFLPAKNVKVRMQTDASLGGNVLQAFAKISEAESVGSFFRGVDIASLGSFFGGLLGFGITEYLKREILVLFPDTNSVVALIVASTVSVLVAAFVLTPFEAVTAKLMSSKGSTASFWGLGLLARTASSEGLGVLLVDYPLLCAKDLLFTVTKFVVFDSLREALLFLVPAFAEEQSLVVACACGALAGAMAAVVSHPIDTLFALRSTGSEELQDGRLPSLERLFQGVSPRVLMYSPGIALQFLVYDAAKELLGEGSGALMQTVDILKTAASRSS